jgi:nitroreductase
MSTPTPRVANAPEMLELLRTVRQARRYRPDPVPDNVLHELLELARWTGSSRNTQPWHFIVVNDRELLSQLAQLRTPINWMAEAALAIVLVLDGKSELEAYDEGRVTERLMIGARLLGLGGGIAWFGDAAEEAQAKQLLGIPAERTARSAVVIGSVITTKDPRPNPAQPGRKPTDETISYNRMGQARG